MSHQKEKEKSKFSLPSSLKNIQEHYRNEGSIRHTQHRPLLCLSSSKAMAIRENKIRRATRCSSWILHRLVMSHSPSKSSENAANLKNCSLSTSPPNRPFLSRTTTRRCRSDAWSRRSTSPKIVRLIKFRQYSADERDRGVDQAGCNIDVGGGIGGEVLNSEAEWGG